MSKVILFGTGRGADVAYRFLVRDSAHQVSGFAVDRAHVDRESFHDLPVVAFEDVERRFPPGEFHMLVMLGYQRMNALRASKYLEAKRKGYSFISYVNSTIYRAQELDIGENCFILDNQSISLDVRIGNNVVMWSSNHIGDLTVIHDHAWVSSHVTIAGEVVVHPYCFLGIGATVTNRVALGERTFVGANALVVSDTNDDAVYLTGGAERADVDSTAFMRVLMSQGKL